jgi:acetyltransferase-like isoleucine patch superfamily enzyme
MLEKFRYAFSSFRKNWRQAERNFKLIDHSKGIHIDPQFIMEDCQLEGNNYFFGSGRASKSSFGAFSYVQFGSHIGYATIGRFCSIGPYVIIAHGDHPLEFLSTHPLFYERSYVAGVPDLTDTALFSSHKQVIIGSDVWIGAHCYIKDGIHIGHGSVIAAGSIVTQDIMPYTIAGGVPAKPIKSRFDEETIGRLISLKWWDWDLKTIIENKDAFQGQFKKDTLARLESKIKTQSGKNAV